MREIGSTEAAGVEYRAIWATLDWIDRQAFPGSGALALVVRDGDGVNHALIRRNAKMPDVDAALRHLRKLGLKEAQLSELFAHKGKGVEQHVKVLVSRLN